MKKFIFSLIYTIPVVLLVVALGNNLSIDNPFLEQQTKQESYSKRDSSDTKEIFLLLSFTPLENFPLVPLV